MMLLFNKIKTWLYLTIATPFNEMLFLIALFGVGFWLLKN